MFSQHKKSKTNPVNGLLIFILEKSHTAWFQKRKIQLDCRCFKPSNTTFGIKLLSDIQAKVLTAWFPAKIKRV